MTPTTRRWANAVTLNESGTGTGVDDILRHDRSWYISQPAGTPIRIDDINTMWVWIPRYIYKISTCHHMSRDQCVTATGQEAGVIDIKFSKGVDDYWQVTMGINTLTIQPLPLVILN